MARIPSHAGVGSVAKIWSKRRAFSSSRAEGGDCGSLFGALKSPDGATLCITKPSGIWFDSCRKIILDSQLGNRYSFLRIAIKGRGRIWMRGLANQPGDQNQAF